MPLQQERLVNIILETEHLEVFAYLEGYLTGLHDAGFIHRERIHSEYNRYSWDVSLNNKKCIFASMDRYKIKDDLTKQLSHGLESSILLTIFNAGYYIDVLELDPKTHVDVGLQKQPFF
ncbi:MAG TPA: hypothetical protein VJJ23_02390 [Candidatus Nanoarchaeia archaeon]|nr:hypothetical protein [Candidatus Nanoarchaeia archaeon]